MVFFFRGKIRAVPGGFHSLLQPFQFVRVADIAVFRANGFTVGFFQVIDNLPEGGWSDTDFIPCLEHLVSIAFFQPEIFNSQARGVLTPGTYGIGTGKQVSPTAVGINQLDHLEFFFGKGGWGFLAWLNLRLLPHLETFEEFPPAEIHAPRISFVLVIHLFKHLGMSAAEETVFFFIFHYYASANANCNLTSFFSISMVDIVNKNVGYFKSWIIILATKLPNFPLFPSFPLYLLAVGGIAGLKKQ
jgi:hypothetical protein